LKYLFLLFSDGDTISLSKYVFNAGVRLLVYHLIVVSSLRCSDAFRLTRFRYLRRLSVQAFPDCGRPCRLPHVSYLPSHQNRKMPHDCIMASIANRQTV